VGTDVETVMTKHKFIRQIYTWHS